MAEVLPAWPNDTDPYLVLCGAKLHLADHKPMTTGDQRAWVILDFAQALCWYEREEERGSHD